MSNSYRPTNKHLIIWKMPNGVYYHKIIKCHYIDYFVGYVNSYGHVVVYIIDNLEFRIHKPNLKERYKKKLITYIEKM